MAFKDIGVDRIIASTAVGSLKKEIRPSEFLVPDQFVNFTKRDDTFYHEHPVTHVSSSDPYCPELRKLLIENGKEMNLAVHEKGTVVVVEGPRFSSRAESNFFRSQKWDIINMTQYPEIILARELEMCYANISVITDYDTGVKDDPTVKSVALEEVVRVFNENNEKLKQLIFKVAPKIPKERNCICRNALEGARF
jgi:5'-methylthioadenosine phosphorylase